MSTTNPFTVEGIDGDRLTPQAPDNLTLRVYAPGANPATAPALYTASGVVAQSTGVKVR